MEFPTCTICVHVHAPTLIFLLGRYACNSQKHLNWVDTWLFMFGVGGLKEMIMNIYGEKYSITKVLSQFHETKTYLCLSPSTALVSYSCLYTCSHDRQSVVSLDCGRLLQTESTLWSSWLYLHASRPTFWPFLVLRHSICRSPHHPSPPWHICHKYT